MSSKVFETVDIIIITIYIYNYYYNTSVYYFLHLGRSFMAF